MQHIRLPNGLWHFDPDHPLGQVGGFGQVFLGRSDSGDEVAVKRLHIAASGAAHRELRVSDLIRGGAFTHVISVLDAGQDSDSDRYFIVMAKAEKSLQDELARLGHFEVPRAVEIALEILDGLDELPDLVHRDLKPPNILFHAGSWKLADFGIARFVEESTSLNTLQGCLSPAYAAPEQWRAERASAATDIYALGCVLQALLTGHPPFPGPERADYREQHLTNPPSRVAAAPPLLQSLVLMMLRKPPDSRPPRHRVRDILRQSQQSGHHLSPAPALAAVAQAGAAEAEREAERLAEAEVLRHAMQRRTELFSEARPLLADIVTTLFDSIRSAAPNVEVEGGTSQSVRQRIERHNLAHLRLGAATLSVFVSPQQCLAEAPRGVTWDIVAGGKITATQATPPYVWSASLWYSRRDNADAFRWREIAYYLWGARERPQYEPFAVDRVADALSAFSSTIKNLQIAWGPVAIDDEDEGEFRERWAALLVKACHGSLAYPSRMPLASGFWR